MIISRTPFRISFAGGGSDLPAFYHREPGAVLSTSIDKYMYVIIHPCFNKDKIMLKYSKTEFVDDFSQIEHPILREVLSMYGIKGVDVGSLADIPSGTGLGSSSSFTVGLLNAVRAYMGKYTGHEKLARLACEIEIEKVGSPIGKQDQYAAACGGLNFITFNADESVNVEKIIMDQDVKKRLQDNLFLVFAGGEHSANAILVDQQKGYEKKDKFALQHDMVQLAFQLRSSLEADLIDDFGRYLHEGWLLKRSLSSGISNGVVDEIYDKGLKAGALGGKLLGAGGAGFVLFYCPEDRHDDLKNTFGSSIVPFNFDNEGSKILYIGEK